MQRSVTIVTPGTHAIPARVTTSVEYAVMHLSPFLAQDMAVTVLGKQIGGGPRQILRDGVRYVRLDARKRSYLDQVARYLRRHPTAFVQVENRPRYVPLLKARLRGVPVWLVLHSLTFMKPAQIPGPVLQRALRLADKIVVNSRFLAGQVLQIDPRLQDKIVINHLGVDPAAFLPRHTPAAEEQRHRQLLALGLAGRKVILYVGRLLPSKGVHHLLQAVARLQACAPRLAVVVVGGTRYGQNRVTPYVRRLRRLARRLACPLRFVPHVPWPNIPRWYGLADVVAVPSTGPEAFGLVNLEAMAAAVPVVASQVGGIPEVVEHGKNGLLVPQTDPVQGLADALYALLVDDEWAQQLGQEGRRQVESNFAWSQAGERLRRLYQEAGPP